MYKSIYFLLFIYLFENIVSVTGINEEYLLREKLFKDYNKYVRPTKNYKDVLDVNISVAVQNIESFDQIQEKIELNLWLRKYWKNERLKWDSNISNITQLTLSKNDVWTPDIELINAATIPDIYTLNGGMYLYPDGNMLWSMPSVYKVSCPLKLKFFPFDKQICSLIFSSWSYDDSLIRLRSHGDKSTQIDVLDTFSHSEWNLKSYNMELYNETRECCPGKIFNVNKYNFELERYTHYYTLNMGMTISLVIVSFIIMMVKPDNLSRTGTAVFIPLTILALELTIAGKIPVVGYYTLMDIFFLTCFITSMMVSIESGLVYTLITSKSKTLYNIFCKILDFDNIVKRYKKTINEDKLRHLKHQYQLKKYISDNKLHDDLLDINDNDNEFTQVDSVLMETQIDTNNDSELTNRSRSYTETINNNNDIFNDIIEKDVMKVIEYNNKDLSITFKEHLIFNEISRISIIIDNFFRVLLPSVFFLMIIIIFSYK